MKRIFVVLVGLMSTAAMAASSPGDMLVQLSSGSKSSTFLALQARMPQGSQIEDIGIAGWVRVHVPSSEVSAFSMSTLRNLPGVLKVQPNHRIKLLENFQLKTQAQREALLRKIQNGELPNAQAIQPDNPAIPPAGSGGSGADPLYSNQWGMNQMGVREAWANTKGSPEVVVAVIDTGVDYTHEDLVDNIWRNPGETGQDGQGRDKSSNGVDDDGNGYVDDVIGWDFAGNDNKPYDLAGSMMEILLQGMNPGHGTHCAGNVAARSDNGKGIAGVAPNVRIMPLRFITKEGGGTTADAMKSIRYAVDNGAKVTSNSWGSEGDDPNDPDTQALKDAIQYAQDHGVLFIAAAGNGHQGVGYNNDTDAKPAVPASYTHDAIISVAAIDEAGALGAFSNWGARSVDLGAPGVKVFSTVVQDENYADTLIDIPGLMTATWDGTSMATPHVAGAAALYISANPTKSWREVKDAVLGSVKRSSVLSGKTVSGGQLDVRSLMN